MRALFTFKRRAFTNRRFVCVVAPESHGDEQRVTAAVRSSLQNLGLSYLDLYLIHWPAASGLPPSDSSNAVVRSKTWDTLVKLHKEEGVLKSIGVSNYTSEHLRQLMKSSAVKPAVNQVVTRLKIVYIGFSRFLRLDTKILLFVGRVSSALAAV